MRSKKSTDKSGDAVNSNVKAITPADVTLPFADDRSVLKKVFVRNAVPREDDYQRLLTQHNDMAYSLGLEKGTLSESVQGHGLVLNSDSKKLEIKLTTSNGGLTVDSSGLALKLKTTVEPNGYKAGVIKADGDGLWINISKEGDRRGLMSYKAGENAVLGIDHDESLTITNGQLSVAASAGIPAGVIVMFSGSIVPNGWALCDGKNGTPDLVDRFIKGSASLSGSTGGSASHIFTPQGSVTVLGHQLSESEMPPHSHHLPTQARGNSTQFTIGEASVVKSVSNHDKLTSGLNGSGAAHSHNASFTGTSHSIPLQPPFYALAFIMKINL